MDNKLIQIMPAPAGIYAITYNDNGNEIKIPLLAVGLTENGRISLLYADLDGSVRKASEIFVSRR